MAEPKGAPYVFPPASAAATGAASGAAVEGDNSSNNNRLFGTTYRTPSSVPGFAAEAVLQQSAPIPGDALIAKGLSFSSPPSLEQLTESLLTTGFQATHLGRAIDVVNEMLNWKPPTKEETQKKQQEKRDRNAKKQRLMEIMKLEGFGDALNFSDDSDLSEEEEGDTAEQQPQQQQHQERKKNQDRCSIWLSFTSNMISSGLRESFVFLAKHKMIVAAVTSAGGVEEDLIKCLGPTVVGDFSLKGQWLRKKGWNRIGNLIVPNENYCRFEDWLQPQLDLLLQRQQERLAQAIQRAQRQKEEVNLSEVVLAPSDVINYLGEAIASHPRHEESFLYWCWRNEIPVFCPGLTDGSLGDNIYFHTYRNSGLVVDIATDVRRANDLAAGARCSGLLILGGGLPKHHTCNAHLMKNGAEFAVYLNSVSDFDGSDSGARPDEAISWGKIKPHGKHVKVTSDATLTFPMLVAATFAKRHFDQQKQQQH